MGDTVSKRELALEIGRFLDQRKGIDTRVLDLTGRAGWTDFFVITTVASNAHLQGIVRNLPGFLREHGAEILRFPKLSAETGWVLIDCNEIVIHLMDKERREFYDLEHLWFQAEALTYSSKSS